MSPNPRLRKTSRRIIVMLATLFGIPLVIYAGFLFVYSWQLTNALEELREAAEAPIDSSGMIETKQTNPDDTSAAYSYLFAELERLEASYEAYEVDLSSLSIYYVLKPESQRSAEEQRLHDEWDRAEERRKEAIVTEHEALIHTFRELTKREGPVVPPGASFQENPRYPYFMSLREIARLLMKHAELAAANANYEEVAEDIVAGLRFSDALALDDSIMVQFSRMAVVSIVADGTEATLNGGEIPSDQVFGLLLAQAAHSAKQDKLPIVIARDALHGREAFDRIRAGDKSVLTSYFAAGDWGEKAGKGFRGVDYHPERIEMKDFVRVAFVKGYTSPLAGPLVDRDECIFLETMTKASALLRLPYLDAMVAFADLKDEIPQTVFSVADTLARTAEHTMTAQTGSIARLDLLRMGLSIERYRKSQGVYPKSLYDIAPILGTEIPMDPFMDEPYRYATDGDLFCFTAWARISKMTVEDTTTGRGILFGAGNEVVSNISVCTARVLGPVYNARRARFLRRQIHHLPHFLLDYLREPAGVWSDLVAVGLPLQFW